MPSLALCPRSAARALTAAVPCIFSGPSALLHTPSSAGRPSLRPKAVSVDTAAPQAPAVPASDAFEASTSSGAEITSSSTSWPQQQVPAGWNNKTVRRMARFERKVANRFTRFREAELERLVNSKSKPELDFEKVTALVTAAVLFILVETEHSVLNTVQDACNLHAQELRNILYFLACFNVVSAILGRSSSRR